MTVFLLVHMTIFRDIFRGVKTFQQKLLEFETFAVRVNSKIYKKEVIALTRSKRAHPDEIGSAHHKQNLFYNNLYCTLC